jgi:hypothetical protein
MKNKIVNIIQILLKIDYSKILFFISTLLFYLATDVVNVDSTPNVPLP